MKTAVTASQISGKFSPPPAPRHPECSNRDRHKLYEGTEKSKYTCKYCGHTFSSIMQMVGGTCAYHPKGSNKGNHAPAL